MSEAMKNNPEANELEAKELEAVSGGAKPIRPGKKLVESPTQSIHRLNEALNSAAQTEEENNG